MRIISGQSLFDVAVQESGSVLAAFDWAKKNGTSITAELVPGANLDSPETEYKDNDVATYLDSHEKRISTSLTQEQYGLVIPPDGIGAMIIEDTFIIN